VQPVTAGRQVGPYRLVEPLGRGGMGEVWRADDVTGASGGTPRQVALKLLDPALTRDPESRARFAREVAAARRVEGPSVAALLDADVDAAQPWLASAYVAGPSLSEHVGRHGPLADAPLRALGAALADALVSIHRAGVVHRDLTPRNVVLGPDGPRVVDFGIAWFAGSPPITRTGAWVGTPAWMAPERVAGDRVTTASDVWSWGAVMAYAARGTPPLAVAGPGPVAGSAPPGPGTGVVGVDGMPGWLDPWVRSAMAPDPAARPTAEQLLVGMSRVPGAQPEPAAPTEPAAPPWSEPGPTQPAVPPWSEPTGVEPPAAQPAPGPAVPPSPTRPYTGGRPAGEVGETAAGRGGRTLARWLSAVLIVGGAAAIGAFGGLLVAAIAVALLLMAAIALRIGRERLPEGARPVPPTWAVGLAGPVALGVALVRALGAVWGAAAMVALIVVFFLLGGDIG
jgi:eukaryotic-like serine/threonine-protein kinase